MAEDPLLGCTPIAGKARLSPEKWSYVAGFDRFKHPSSRERQGIDNESTEGCDDVAGSLRIPGHLAGYPLQIPE